MEGMENEEFDRDGLKLPSDAEESDLDDPADGPGFHEYDDEEGFSEGMQDDYGDERGREVEGADEDEDEEGDNDDEIDEVFA